MMNSIFKNSLYNLAGSALPLVVAVFTIPLLIRGFGKERFGILSLAWVLIGYFSFADFGLSRTLTKFVSERAGQGRVDTLPGLIWTALFLITVLGLIGALGLALFAPFLVTSLLNIESTSPQEIIRSFYILAIGIPFTIGSSGLRGVLEAYLRFDITNTVRIVLGVFNFLGPVLVLLFTVDIGGAVAVLVISRALCFIAYFKKCVDIIPGMTMNPRLDRSQIGPLFRFGSWITVSNLISPLMVNFDRFLLGAMVSVSALAYYSTPWEVMARLLIIPTALSGVMFPVFSSMMSADRTPTRDLYDRSLTHVFVLMYPICLFCASFSGEILRIWVGNDLAAGSFRIMQVMAVAVLINGIAMIPYSFIQAAGRPDITAKYHLLELIIYIPLLWLLIREWAILGAALAWLARVTFDLSLLLGYVSKKAIGIPAGEDRREKPAAWLVLFLLISCLIVPSFLMPLEARAVWLVLALTAFIFVTWRRLLSAEDKEMITRKLGWLTR